MSWIKKLTRTDYGDQLHETCFNVFKVAQEQFYLGDYESAAEISSEFLKRFPDSSAANIVKQMFTREPSLLKIQNKLWIPFSDDFILMASIGSYVQKDFYSSINMRCILSVRSGEYPWYPGGIRPADLPESDRGRIRMPRAGRRYGGTLWESVLLTLNTLYDAKTHEVDVGSFNISIPDQYEITRAYNNGYLVPRMERLPFQVCMRSATLKLEYGKNTDTFSFTTEEIIEKYKRIAMPRDSLRFDPNMQTTLSREYLNNVAKSLFQNGYSWK